MGVCDVYEAPKSDFARRQENVRHVLFLMREQTEENNRMIALSRDAIRDSRRLMIGFLE